jgi:hypothetical protein
MRRTLCYRRQGCWQLLLGAADTQKPRARICVCRPMWHATLRARGPHAAHKRTQTQPSLVGVVHPNDEQRWAAQATTHTSRLCHAMAYDLATTHPSPPRTTVPNRTAMMHSVQGVVTHPSKQPHRQPLACARHAHAPWTVHSKTRLRAVPHTHNTRQGARCMNNCAHGACEHTHVLLCKRACLVRCTERGKAGALQPRMPRHPAYTTRTLCAHSKAQRRMCARTRPQSRSARFVARTPMHHTHAHLHAETNNHQMRQSARRPPPPGLSSTARQQHTAAAALRTTDGGTIAAANVRCGGCKKARSYKANRARACSSPLATHKLGCPQGKRGRDNDIDQGAVRCSNGGQPAGEHP